LQAVVQAARQYLEADLARGTDLSRLRAFGSDTYWTDVLDYMEGYEEALRGNNAFDFDDLLGWAVALLEREDSVRQTYLRRFR